MYRLCSGANRKSAVTLFSVTNSEKGRENQWICRIFFCSISKLANGTQFKLNETLQNSRAPNPVPKSNLMKLPSSSFNWMPRNNRPAYENSTKSSKMFGLRPAWTSNINSRLYTPFRIFLYCSNVAILLLLEEWDRKNSNLLAFDRNCSKICKFQVVIATYTGIVSPLMESLRKYEIFVWIFGGNIERHWISSTNIDHLQCNDGKCCKQQQWNWTSHFLFKFYRYDTVKMSTLSDLFLSMAAFTCTSLFWSKRTELTSYLSLSIENFDLITVIHDDFFLFARVHVYFYHDILRYQWLSNGLVEYAQCFCQLVSRTW